jgi:hypothetical protein
MKNFGSKFEHEQERNEDIMRAYLEQIRSCENIYLPQVLTRVVNMPSKRFWVSAERAAVVVSMMMRGKELPRMLPTKREMFEEIYRRVLILKEKNPHMSLFELSLQVVQEPAPKFYLTAGSAKVIIHRAKKQWYEKRRLRLRHSQSQQ